MAVNPVGVAVVGCGTISHQYLATLANRPEVRVVACADLDPARAASAAARYGVPVHGDLDTVLAHDEVELVVNLTVPAAHAPVALAAIAEGKHVYTEKPFALTPTEASTVLAAAQAAGVRTGGAPDTFLGAGMQTTCQAVADGRIGTPLSAIVLEQGPGPHRWHPDPEFLFQAGGGPLFDMGPYYLTALAALFGPVTRVAALNRTGFPERVIGAGPRTGQRFPVTVPTHVTALIEYASGPVATVVFSFDATLPRQDFFEITGTEATLAAPNPNTFTGPVRLRATSDSDWTTIPTPDSPTDGRGIGICDMAVGIRTNRPHHANGDLAAHIVDVMTAIHDSAEHGTFRDVTSTFTRM
ncbi:Gfo/Idh/MocA family protein [Phytohabitans houttuyneae]|uniref:Oxidoreductase n=1 Tax=Phytohabitans houttuyneae TaxID=1076126 RepID=A0A6V8KHK9_9ACTN|nr:Gfo/Idh/MocA family oxidoreductase [Phytohabitans houttuyneae]GFJ81187.1 oxidoreductase [Phytohabitans houttuyneae]